MKTNSKIDRIFFPDQNIIPKEMLFILLCIFLLINRLVAQTPTVVNLSATGNNIKWYTSSSGGVALDPGTPLVNGQHYWASQTINGCESTTRFEATASVITQVAPVAATHIPSQTQVVWNWNTAPGASGYKWNTVNVYSSATDMAAAITKTETGLTCNTTYDRYIWAYNASGCVSSATTLSQTASSCASPPSVTTNNVSNIGSNSATLSGSITATNGANATVRGFKYSTSSGFDPVTAGINVPESGSFSTGVFTAGITGLLSTTNYYIHAYATNSAGTTYGDQVIFTTVIYTSWTFSNAGATGRTGPTQEQVNSAYTGTSLQGGVTVNTEGIQEWTVPSTSQYTIRAYGAQGARSGGLGADMTGTFNLTQGEVIKIVVGQTGVDGSNGSYLGGGGGGGSFAIRSPYNDGTAILVIGGGGGGYTNFGTTAEMNAFATSSGGSTYSGGGGSSGNGGNCGSNGAAAGGGGFLTNGVNGTDPTNAGGGLSFINGATGGTEGNTSSFNGGDGGFGGGGGGWHNILNRSGGGGGYSGGQGGGWNGQPSGGGGGSYNNGTSQSNIAASHSGQGQVVITRVQVQTDFSYTGSMQTFTVPAGVTSVTIEAWGAQGWSGTYSGGLGGYATGTLAVTPGQDLYINVGGQGAVAVGTGVPSGGGWNGGGNGQTNGSPNSAGGGGGASDIRSGGTTLANRVIVAAGGGGSTNNGSCDGGNGGGLAGSKGGGAYGGGYGGTQLAGGSFGGDLGQGGNALVSYTPWNGGGGGGYYGGGTSDAHGSGGGGSSYTGGMTGASTTTGQRSGNGRVKISY